MRANRAPARLRVDHVLMAILLGGMVLLSFVNVLGRYLFHYSLAFTEEVTINMFVWLTVLGSGVAFERCGHLGMVSLFKVLPGRMQRGIVVLSAVLGAALFVVIDVLLVRMIHADLTLFHATSPALGIPVWIYYAGVILLSPFVFRGIHRGARAQVAAVGTP